MAIRASRTTVRVRFSMELLTGRVTPMIRASARRAIPLSGTDLRVGGERTVAGQIVIDDRLDRLRHPALDVRAVRVELLGLEFGIEHAKVRRRVRPAPGRPLP